MGVKSSPASRNLGQSLSSHQRNEVRHGVVRAVEALAREKSLSAGSQLGEQPGSGVPQPLLALVEIFARWLSGPDGRFSYGVARRTGHERPPHRPLSFDLFLTE